MKLSENEIEMTYADRVLSSSTNPRGFGQAEEHIGGVVKIIDLKSMIKECQDL